MEKIKRHTTTDGSDSRAFFILLFWTILFVGSCAFVTNRGAAETGGAAEALKDFHKEAAKEVSPTPFVLSDDIPILISHTPEVLSGVRYVNRGGTHYMVGEVEMLRKQVQRIRILKGLPLDAPSLNLGLIYDFQNKPAVFLSLKQTANITPNQGFGIKATIISRDFQSLMEKATGTLSPYYYFNHTGLFRREDFISLFVGWNSDEVPVDFSSALNPKEFQLIENIGKQLAYGVFYRPSVFSGVSIGLEGNQDFFAASLYYKISR